MKDHEIRELVTELTEVAQEYGQTQQLRERIRGVVFKYILPSFLNADDTQPWFEHIAADGTKYWLHTPPISEKKNVN